MCWRKLRPREISLQETTKKQTEIGFKLASAWSPHFSDKKLRGFEVFVLNYLLLLVLESSAHVPDKPKLSRTVPVAFCFIAEQTNS